MFTIKAEKHSSSLDVPASPAYFFTQADSYEVLWTNLREMGNPTGFGSTDPVDDRVAQISMFDRGQEGSRSLFVGCNQTFERVYVMNDRGQTVDVIRL